MKAALAPTPHQAEKIAEAVEWWNLPQGHPDYYNLIFTGPAGAGKTFCVKSMLKQLTNVFPLVTATTNEAVHQLELAGTSAITCHKALTLRPVMNVEVPYFTRTEYGPLEAFDGVNLLLVEEASMAGKAAEVDEHKQLVDYIYEERVRTIWLGDRYQLPPVGAARGLAPIFYEGHRTVELTEVVRNSGNILSFCTQLRTIIDKPVRRMPKHIDLPTRTSQQLYAACEDNAQMLDHFLHHDLVCITWRNAVADTLNNKLRRQLHGGAAIKNSIIVGDRILLTTPLVAGEFPDTVEGLPDTKKLRQVASVNTKAEVTRVVVAELYGVECFKATLSVEGGNLEVAYIPTSRGATQLSKRLKQFTEAAKASTGAKAAKLWTIKNLFDGCFLKFVHGFVITANRAQGSTRKEVIVNTPDILSNRNQAEAYRRMYTAASRASEKLTIIRG